ALPEISSIPFNNPNQENSSIHNNKETHNEKVECLLIHSYNDRIEQHQVDRSINNTILVDLKEGFLYLTEEYVNALKSLISIPEAENYMRAQVFIALIDYPGQLHVQRAITRRIKFGDSSGIPAQILHMVTMIGPLHVSLNSCEMVFLLNYYCFDLLFYSVFGCNKVLAKKPKPYRINLILELACQDWL
ncbi:20427_t:CDS:2, partial [Gigaspora rosea]